MTHPVSGAVSLLRWRGLVLGWTTETQRHTAVVFSESQKHETCCVAFHLMEQFANSTQNKQQDMKKAKVKWTEHIRSHRYSLCIVVTVFAVHGYACSNDGQEYNDPDDGSYDAACGGTLLWETSFCGKRENTIRQHQRMDVDSQFSQEIVLKSFW